MKKLLILILLITPVLFLAGCGSKTPEEQAAANLAKDGLGFMKNIVEMGENKEDLTEEEMAKQVMGEYADFMGGLADGTEDELTDEEKVILHAAVTDPEAIGEMVDDAMEEENE